MQRKDTRQCQKTRQETQYIRDKARDAIPKRQNKSKKQCKT